MYKKLTGKKLFLCGKQNTNLNIEQKTKRKETKTITHKFYQKLLPERVFCERGLCKEVSLPGLLDYVRRANE